MRSFYVFAALLFVGPAYSSTFVGNGGNSGDIELNVSIQQIRATLEALKQENDSDGLCVCSEQFRERAVCNHLNGLSSAQVLFCAKTLQGSVEELLSLVHHNSTVRFAWTTESIVVEETGGPRSVEAVTNSKNKTITLNQDSFLGLTPTQRVFLLSHELFHLIKFDDSYFSDEQSYPPFTGVQAGRNFINAMASSLTLESMVRTTSSKFTAPLSRSQSSKRHWMSLGLIRTQNDTSQSSSYNPDSFSGFAFGYRYQPGPLGLVLDISGQKGSRKVLTSIEVNEQRTTVGLGVAYRFYPFYEPMTFLGQSHFIFTGKFESRSGKIEVSDSTPGLDPLRQEKSSTGWSVEGNYFIPLKNNLWAYANVRYSQIGLSYEDLDLEYTDNNFTYGLGASYAF